MAFNPKSITRQHVLDAIKEIEEKKIELIPSTKYDVIYEGRSYPPKAVMRIAHRIANGEEIWENSGGEPTNKYFEQFGFEIREKSDPVSTLIDKYKRLISKSKLEDEKYKWELVEKYKGRPDPSKTDLLEEVKSVEFSNLMYAMGIAVLRHLAADKTEALRKCLIDLFDDSIELKDRIIHFRDKTLEIYRELEPKLPHHMDERTTATILTYHNPDKYTFYKSSFYEKYCKLLGVKKAKTKYKYVHYLQLIDELINNYVSKDAELIELVKSCIPEYYDGSNHLILAQDILYQVLDQEKNVNYWIFQGNPKVYDFKTALKEGILVDWTVSAHKEIVKVGDKVIIWISGNNGGCYALAEISEEPHVIDNSPDDHLWKKDKTSELKAGLKITYNLVDHPISKEQIANKVELVELNIGHQGTNFKATKKEYETFLSMAQGMDNKKYWLYAPGENAEHWEEFYNQGIMGLGWEALGDLNSYKSKNEIVDKLRKIEDTSSSKKNDATANWEFKQVISEGDVVIVKKGRNELLGYGEVTSDYYCANSRTSFKKCRSVNWKKKGNWKTDHSLALKTLTDVTSYPIQDSNYEFYYQRLLGLMEDNMEPNPKLNIPKNLILYGPPGTGKTYKLKNEYFSKFTSLETSISREQYLTDMIDSLSWWKVIAAVLLDLKKVKVSDIQSHEFIQIKSELSRSKHIRPGLWGQLQSHTVKDCEYVNVSRRLDPLIFNKTEDSFWEIYKEEAKEYAPEAYELLNSSKNYTPDPDKEIKRYRFLTFHQSYSYEDFIEGIKPTIGDATETDISYEVKSGIFKTLCQRASKDPENDYALFIDEINRGNVSNIFGELITLIEDDKRSGAKNELSATLPYSGETFSVPPNLYIIGTMNTADRSVEALDTALRRRFSFQELIPDPSLLANLQVSDLSISLQELLIGINKRIEVLVDRDHMIGHAFFMKVKSLSDLKKVFADKIIPLLQEYFYGDYGKMQMVIGKAFFEEQNGKVTFASHAYPDEERFQEADIFHLRNVKEMDDSDFMEALEQLIDPDKAKQE